MLKPSVLLVAAVLLLSAPAWAPPVSQFARDELSLPIPTLTQLTDTAVGDVRHFVTDTLASRH